MTVLAASGLTVSATLGGARGRAVPVLRDLSFSLQPGTILGLVGESGAGKSMLGRAIAQLLPPGFAVTAGTLAFEGRDLVTMGERERRALLGRAIASIPQAPLTALNPVLTIGQQFDEHLARLGREARPARRARAQAMLEAAHLPDAEALLSRYPHQLSGGMCQRVLIAMAFASDPRLVIADEPTTALDVTLHARIIGLITEMQRRHRTALIFITHDLRLAAQICDQILVLYAGRAIEQGPGRAVLAAPAHPYTRCLQLANPTMGPERRALHVLPEQMPGLRQRQALPGCAFAPRCPLVEDECRAAEPATVAIGEGRTAACRRAGDAGRITSALIGEDARARGAAQPVLEIRGLVKHYRGAGSWFGRARPVTAVDAASFALAANEFVALVGASGSGKSTIAKLLLGIERPDAGQILLDGRDIADGSAASRALRTAAIQMVFQDPHSALNPRRRVASIISQALEAGSHRVDPRERQERARALLAELGLPAECGTHFPAQLSGGQRQRVNIARALCKVPRILIADEIVSGLDVSIQAQLLTLLARLRDELGFAMLFISHDLSVVRHLCSRVLVMYRGAIVEQGPTEEVFASPQHPHTQALLAAVPPDAPEAEWPLLRAGAQGMVRRSGNRFVDNTMRRI